MQTEKSQELFRKAQQVLVGGVNSPVRAFKAVGKTPIFMKKGSGSHLLTEDGQLLVDYVLSFGALLLGHAQPQILAAIVEAAQMGTSFGAPCRLEVELAQLIQFFYPSCEKIRFVNSGTEATMTAIRLARGVTKRKKIIKFKGCYHGHVDSLLVQAGSGALTFAQPDSKGVLPEFVMHTLLCEFNDILDIERTFASHAAEIAGIIIEPVCGNMGVVLPDAAFLMRVQQLCSQHGSLLIFDEVMCGFRVDLGGAQALYSMQPDLTCLGKVIGGGLPCGAIGGKSEIMAHLSPNGGVYHAGTFSGNPITMAAGIAMLTQLKEDAKLFEKAVAATAKLTQGLRHSLHKRSLPYQVNTLGTMFTLFFTSQAVTNLASVQTCDLQKFSAFFNEMLQRGIYFAPSQFEANFLSSAHSDADIEQTLAAFDEVLALPIFCSEEKRQEPK